MKPGKLAGRFTLIQQWMAATVLAVIPLLFAVSYAAYAFQQQTQKQREMVETLDRYSRSSNAIADTVKELVRLSRQYQLLGNESFLELYRQKRASLDEPVQSLITSLPNGGHRKLLTSLERQADSILLTLEQQPPGEAEGLSEQLRTLVSQSESLTTAVNLYQNRAIQLGEQTFNRIVDQLFFLSILALPGTLLLMVIGSYTVSRPLWRLSQAIRSLGTQNWDTPIDIHGPSDLVALGDNLEWMRRQVVRSDQQKTAFIQHVTHELKTPLAAIIEAGNLLKDEVSGPLSEGQQDILGILRVNSRNLQELIEQLLNYNAVSHGIRPHLQTIPLMPLCESIRRGLETASPGKVLRWTFEGAPDQVYSDPTLVEMILKNLMGNAVQFSPPGGEVQVRWQEDNGHWQLSVSDQGPGIDEDEIDKIFQPFYKGRTGREDRVPKNGIGLAIVNECVILLQGRIVTESQKSRGTTFTMTFPSERGTTR